MRFLVSMVFVGMLASSNNAFADKVSGAQAEEILVKGRDIASFWDTNTNYSRLPIHHTRVIYKVTYYACVTSLPNSSKTEDKLYAHCWNVKPPANQ